MPNINITVTASDDDTAALQAWFAVWNTKLAVPYANLADAIRGECQNQVDAWIQNARPTIGQAWQDATPEEQAAIKAEVERITGKTISD